MISQKIRSLGERLEKTRLHLNISQSDLAKSAGISERTLRRLESGEGGTVDSLMRVLTALGLDDNLTNLVPDYAVRPVERARDAKTERRRASKSKPEPKTSEPDSQWTWGDERT